MSIRYNPKVSALEQRKISSFFKKDRFDKNRIKTPNASTWVRPADWLTMPEVSSTDQKVVLLVSVYDHDSNFLAVLCSGNYTVDWGDGIINNVSSGVKAEHVYTYNTLSSVVCTEGYKMAIVTITPQSGQSLTSVDLKQLHTNDTATSICTPILEFIFSCPNHGSTLPKFGSGYLNILRNCIFLNVGATTSFSSLFTDCKSLLNATITADASAVSTCDSMFEGCSSLLKALLLNVSSATTMQYMFKGCSSLQTIHLFNTPAVTSMRQMFQDCISLRSVPLFNTAAVTNMFQMFAGCASLQNVPLFNTVSVDEMMYMFTGCTSLQSVPLFNTSSVTSMLQMFYNCTSLQSVPLFNTAAVTIMSSMFSGCTSLQGVPLFNTAAVTSMINMFDGCTSLQSVPLFNTSAVLGMSNMFNGCTSLQSVPLFNTAAVTSMSNMFNGCTSLQVVPLFNMVSVTSASSMFSGTKALSVGALSNNKATISYDSCKLSKTEIENIFNYLGVGTSRTITISNNWGAPATITKSGTSTLKSTTIAMTNTISLSAGMLATGVGSPLTTAIAVTLQTTANTVTLTTHGLSDGDRVSFPSITTTTGIVINTIYYVVNKTNDTFQVAASIGGPALTLTNNGTATLKYDTEIVSIVANTSITMSRPMTSSGTNTLAYRLLKTSTALLKGWTVTG